jgi:hypothetical protein
VLRSSSRAVSCIPARDVNIFLDENKELIQLLGKEFREVKDDQKYLCMEYHYIQFSIDVWYGAGACKRVKVSSTQKVVIEDEYEIVCEDE